MSSRRRVARLALAIPAALVLLLLLGWSYLAHHARWFISDIGQAEHAVLVGTTLRTDGPYLHSPDGDMYLIYWNLHHLPWLFRWTAQQPGDGPSEAVSVDWLGRVHALAPGVADVYARPILGSGFATARYRVSSPGGPPPAP